MATNSGVIEEGDNSGFVKILRKSDLLSESTREIPYDFIKTISDKCLYGDMILTVTCGGGSSRNWSIKICRNQRFYYMDETDWDQFLKDNELGNNDSVTFNHKGYLCFILDIYKADSANVASSSRGNREETESNSPGLKTAESTRTRQRLNLGNKKANTVRKDYGVPEFTLSINNTYLQYLGIPSKFAEMYMPKEKTMFKINHMDSEKTWEVMYVVTEKFRRFSGGWISLVNDLGLVVGDVCTFKLIKPTEMLLEVSEDPSLITC